MNEIHGTARIVIHLGKLEEFKHFAARCVEIVQTKDSGTPRVRPVPERGWHRVLRPRAP